MALHEHILFMQMHEDLPTAEERLCSSEKEAWSLFSGHFPFPSVWEDGENWGVRFQNVYITLFIIKPIYSFAFIFFNDSVGKTSGARRDRVSAQVRINSAMWQMAIGVCAQIHQSLSCTPNPR